MHRLDGPDTICRVTTPPKGKSYPFYMELQHTGGSVLQVRAASQQQLQTFVDAAVATFMEVVVETDEVEPPLTPQRPEALPYDDSGEPADSDQDDQAPLGQPGVPSLLPLQERDSESSGPDESLQQQADGAAVPALSPPVEQDAESVDSPQPQLAMATPPELQAEDFSLQPLQGNTGAPPSDSPPPPPSQVLPDSGDEHTPAFPGAVRFSSAAQGSSQAPPPPAIDSASMQPASQSDSQPQPTSPAARQAAGTDISVAPHMRPIVGGAPPSTPPRLRFGPQSAQSRPLDPQEQLHAADDAPHVPDNASIASDTLRTGSTLLLLEPTPGQSHLRREDWVERFAEVSSLKAARGGSGMSPQRGRQAELVVYNAPLDTSVLRTHDLASCVATGASRHHTPPQGAKCFTLILGTGKVVFAAAPSESARNDWLDRLEQFAGVAVNDSDRESPEDTAEGEPASPAALDSMDDATVAIARRAMLGVQSTASGSARALNPLQPPSSPQDAARSGSGATIGTRKRNSSVARSISPASESTKKASSVAEQSPPLSPVEPPAAELAPQHQDIAPQSSSKATLWPPEASSNAGQSPPKPPPSAGAQLGPPPARLSKAASPHQAQPSSAARTERRASESKPTTSSPAAHFAAEGGQERDEAPPGAPPAPAIAQRDPPRPPSPALASLPRSLSPRSSVPPPPKPVLDFSAQLRRGPPGRPLSPRAALLSPAPALLLGVDASAEETATEGKSAPDELQPLSSGWQEPLTRVLATTVLISSDDADSTTVGELLQSLKSNAEPRAEQVRFAGQVLRDLGATLRCCGVPQGEEVQIDVALRGGEATHAPSKHLAVRPLKPASSPVSAGPTPPSRPPPSSPATAPVQPAAAALRLRDRRLSVARPSGADSTASNDSLVALRPAGAHYLHDSNSDARLLATVHSLCSRLSSLARAASALPPGAKGPWVATLAAASSQRMPALNATADIQSDLKKQQLQRPAAGSDAPGLSAGQRSTVHKLAQEVVLEANVSSALASCKSAVAAAAKQGVFWGDVAGDMQEHAVAVGVAHTTLKGLLGKLEASSADPSTPASVKLTVRRHAAPIADAAPLASSPQQATPVSPPSVQQQQLAAPNADSPFAPQAPQREEEAPLWLKLQRMRGVQAGSNDPRAYVQAAFDARGERSSPFQRNVRSAGASPAASPEQKADSQQATPATQALPVASPVAIPGSGGRFESLRRSSAFATAIGKVRGIGRTPASNDAARPTELDALGQGAATQPRGGRRDSTGVHPYDLSRPESTQGVFPPTGQSTMSSSGLSTPLHPYGVPASLQVADLAAALAPATTPAVRASAPPATSPVTGAMPAGNADQSSRSITDSSIEVEVEDAAGADSAEVEVGSPQAYRSPPPPEGPASRGTAALDAPGDTPREVQALDMTVGTPLHSPTATLSSVALMEVQPVPTADAATSTPATPGHVTPPKPGAAARPSNVLSPTQAETLVASLTHSQASVLADALQRQRMGEVLQSPQFKQLAQVLAELDTSNQSTDNEHAPVATSGAVHTSPALEPGPDAASDDEAARLQELTAQLTAALEANTSLDLPDILKAASDSDKRSGEAQLPAANQDSAAQSPPRAQLVGGPSGTSGGEHVGHELPNQAQDSHHDTQVPFPPSAFAGQAAAASQQPVAAATDAEEKESESTRHHSADEGDDSMSDGAPQAEVVSETVDTAPGTPTSSSLPPSQDGPKMDSPTQMQPPLPETHQSDVTAAASDADDGADAVSDASSDAGSQIDLSTSPGTAAPPRTPFQYARATPQATSGGDAQWSFLDAASVSGAPAGRTATSSQPGSYARLHRVVRDHRSVISPAAASGGVGTGNTTPTGATQPAHNASSAYLSGGRMRRKSPLPLAARGAAAAPATPPSARSTQGQAAHSLGAFAFAAADADSVHGPIQGWHADSSSVAGSFVEAAAAATTHQSYPSLDNTQATNASVNNSVFVLQDGFDSDSATDEEEYGGGTLASSTRTPAGQAELQTHAAFQYVGEPEWAHVKEVPRGLPTESVHGSVSYTGGSGSVHGRSHDARSSRHRPGWNASRRPQATWGSPLCAADKVSQINELPGTGLTPEQLTAQRRAGRAARKARLADLQRAATAALQASQRKRKHKKRASAARQHSTDAPSPASAPEEEEEAAAEPVRMTRDTRLPRGRRQQHCSKEAATHSSDTHPQRLAVIDAGDSSPELTARAEPPPSALQSPIQHLSGMSLERLRRESPAMLNAEPMRMVFEGTGVGSESPPPARAVQGAGASSPVSPTLGASWQGRSNSPPPKLAMAAQGNAAGLPSSSLFPEEHLQRLLSAVQSRRQRANTHDEKGVLQAVATALSSAIAAGDTQRRGEHSMQSIPQLVQPVEEARRVLAAYFETHPDGSSGVLADTASLSLQTALGTAETALLSVAMGAAAHSASSAVQQRSVQLQALETAKEQAQREREELVAQHVAATAELEAQWRQRMELAGQDDRRQQALAQQMQDDLEANSAAQQAEMQALAEAAKQQEHDLRSDLDIAAEVIATQHAAIQKLQRELTEAHRVQRQGGSSVSSPPSNAPHASPGATAEGTVSPDPACSSPPPAQLPGEQQAQLPPQAALAHLQKHGITQAPREQVAQAAMQAAAALRKSGAAHGGGSAHATHAAALPGLMQALRKATAGLGASRGKRQRALDAMTRRQEDQRKALNAEWNAQLDAALAGVPVDASAAQRQAVVTPVVSEGNEAMKALVRRHRKVHAALVQQLDAEEDTARRQVAEAQLSYHDAASQLTAPQRQAAHTALQLEAAARSIQAMPAQQWKQLHEALPPPRMDTAALTEDSSSSTGPGSSAPEDGTVLVAMEDLFHPHLASSGVAPAAEQVAADAHLVSILQETGHLHVLPLLRSWQTEQASVQGTQGARSTPVSTSTLASLAEPATMQALQVFTEGQQEQDRFGEATWVLLSGLAHGVKAAALPSPHMPHTPGTESSPASSGGATEQATAADERASPAPSAGSACSAASSSTAGSEDLHGDVLPLDIAAAAHADLVQLLTDVRFLDLLPVLGVWAAVLHKRSHEEATDVDAGAGGNAGVTAVTREELSAALGRLDLPLMATLVHGGNLQSVRTVASDMHSGALQVPEGVQPSQRLLSGGAPWVLLRGLAAGLVPKPHFDGHEEAPPTADEALHNIQQQQQQEDEDEATGVIWLELTPEVEVPCPQGTVLLLQAASPDLVRFIPLLAMFAAHTQASGGSSASHRHSVHVDGSPAAAVALADSVRNLTPSAVLAAAEAPPHSLVAFIATGEPFGVNVGVPGVFSSEAVQHLQSFARPAAPHTQPRGLLASPGSQTAQAQARQALMPCENAYAFERVDVAPGTSMHARRGVVHMFDEEQLTPYLPLVALFTAAVTQGQVTAKADAQSLRTALACLTLDLLQSLGREEVSRLRDFCVEGGAFGAGGVLPGAMPPQAFERLCAVLGLRLEPMSVVERHAMSDRAIALMPSAPLAAAPLQVPLAAAAPQQPDADKQGVALPHRRAPPSMPSLAEGVALLSPEAALPSNTAKHTIDAELQRGTRRSTLHIPKPNLALAAASAPPAAEGRCRGTGAKAHQAMLQARKNVAQKRRTDDAAMHSAVQAAAGRVAAKDAARKAAASEKGTAPPPSRNATPPSSLPHGRKVDSGHAKRSSPEGTHSTPLYLANTAPSQEAILRAHLMNRRRAGHSSSPANVADTDSEQAPPPRMPRASTGTTPPPASMSPPHSSFTSRIPALTSSRPQSSKQPDSKLQRQRQAALQELHAPFPSAAGRGVAGGLPQSQAVLESTLPAPVPSPDTEDTASPRRRRQSPSAWASTAPPAPSDWRRVQGGRPPMQHVTRTLASADETNAAAQATVDRFHKREGGGARDPPPPPLDSRPHRRSPSNLALGDSYDSGILFPLTDISVSSLPVPRSPFSRPGDSDSESVSN